MRNVYFRFVWTASAVCASFVGLANSAPAMQAEKWQVENLDQNQRFFVVVNGKEVETQDAEHGAPKNSKYWLGISLKPIDGDLATYLGTNEGVLVDSVLPESPAEKAGLKKGDIVIDVNGEKLAEPQSLLTQMLAVKAADDGKVPALKMNVLRKRETVQIELIPTERPIEAVQHREGQAGTEDVVLDQKVMTFDLRGKSPEDIEKMVEGGLRVFRIGQPTGWRQNGTDGALNVEIHLENNGKKSKISIKRDGNGPAKIAVKRDGESKEYTSEKMAEMPEDIRKVVQEILEKNVQIDGDNKQSKKSSQSRSRIAIVGPDGLDLNIGEFMKGEAMQKELAEKYRAMAEEIADRAQRSAFWGKDAAAMPQEMKALQSQVEALRAEVEELRQQLKLKEKETADK